jgi:flagellar FliJ protein
LKNQPHFETARGRKAEKVAALLAELHHDISMLELSIAAEEEESGNHDPSHYAYPFTAKMMATRRDNLKATAAALGQQHESGILELM